MPMPVLGIGALLFKPRVKIVKGSEWRGNKDGDVVDALSEAGKFFVDAFWTGKVGGGASSLSTTQASTLERQQILEFKRRYKSAPAQQAGGGSGSRLPGNYAGRRSSSMDKRSELVLCVGGSSGGGEEVAGCAGVEVSEIKKMDGYDGSLTAPLMSNLAVSRAYRRRGLAEDLVRAAESIARREWGYDECYLYVEKRNVPAIKLYSKLGYKKLWEDDDATTLLPTKDGRVINGKTTIVCMRKGLGGGGLFGGMFGS